MDYEQARKKRQLWLKVRHVSDSSSNHSYFGDSDWSFFGGLMYLISLLKFPIHGIILCVHSMRILPNILAVSLNAATTPAGDLVKNFFVWSLLKNLCEGVCFSFYRISGKGVGAYIYFFDIFIQICSYKIIRFCGVFCGFVYHTYTGKLQNLQCMITFKVMFLFLCHVLHIFS